MIIRFKSIKERDSNFIFLQNGTIKENEDDISWLLKFCEKHRVGRLIQISSISSYPNSASIISEDSRIDLNIELKGRYGQMKVAADFKLEQASKKMCIRDRLSGVLSNSYANSYHYQNGLNNM